MDKEFFGLSGMFRIVGQLRNSKAAYAEGLEVGDILLVKMGFSDLGRGSQGNYVPTLTMYLQKREDGDKDDLTSYEEFSTISQNEFFKVFKNVEEELPERNWGIKPIFLVQSFDLTV